MYRAMSAITQAFDVLLSKSTIKSHEAKQTTFESSFYLRNNEKFET